MAGGFYFVREKNKDEVFVAYLTCRAKYGVFVNKMCNQTKLELLEPVPAQIVRSVQTRQMRLLNMNKLLSCIRY